MSRTLRSQTTTSWWAAERISSAIWVVRIHICASSEVWRLMGSGRQPRHLLDEVDVQAPLLEHGAEVVAQRRLAHAVGADEGELDHGGGRILSGAPSRCRPGAPRAVMPRGVRVSDVYEPVGAADPPRRAREGASRCRRRTCCSASSSTSPRTSGMGRYCWNAECRYCEVHYTRPGDPTEHVGLACRLRGFDGMRLTKLAAGGPLQPERRPLRAPREEERRPRPAGLRPAQPSDPRPHLAVGGHQAVPRHLEVAASRSRSTSSPPGEAVLGPGQQLGAGRLQDVVGRAPRP